eukprot:5908279-Prymnesium_polylepis.2
MVQLRRHRTDAIASACDAAWPARSLALGVDLHIQADTAHGTHRSPALQRRRAGGCHQSVRHRLLGQSPEIVP